MHSERTKINVMNSVKFVQISVMDPVIFVQISVTDSVEVVQSNVMDPVKFVQINVMNSVKFVQINVMDSVEVVQISVKDPEKFMQISVMDLVFQEEIGETKSTSRRNRFFALTAIESDDDEEVNAIETVQEVVDITVDSGAAKSVWPSRKKGIERTKSKKAVKLSAANGISIRVEGDARLEFIRDGMKCSMKFLDADVKRPLASVSAIVDEGNVVVFGQHESFIENVSTGQRIPMCRRNGVFVMRLDTQPCQKTTKSVKFNKEDVIKKMSGRDEKCGRNSRTL